MIINLEISTFRALKPEDIANRSGGVIEYKGQMPWDINYENASLHWRGYPKRRQDVLEATPFMVKNESHSGCTVSRSSVLLSDNFVIIVYPGPDDDTFAGEFLQDGRHQALRMPTSQIEVINPILIVAKKIALQNLPRLCR